MEPMCPSTFPYMCTSLWTDRHSQEVLVAWKVTLANHKIQRQEVEGAEAGISFTVTPDSQCVWKCTQSHGKGKGRKSATHTSIGAHVSKEVIEASEHVTWHIKFTCSANYFLDNCVALQFALHLFLQLVEQVRVEGAEHQAFVAVVVAEEANSVDQGLLGKSCMMLGVDCLMVSVQEVI
jgi:hypothetical protein